MPKQRRRKPRKPRLPSKVSPLSSDDNFDRAFICAKESLDRNHTNAIVYALQGVAEAIREAKR